MAGNTVGLQHLQHRRFQPKDILLDEDTQAAQVHQRVSHHLARPMESDLAAALGAHDRNVTRHQHVLGATAHPLGKDGVMLHHPEFVGGLRAPRLGKGTHARLDAVIGLTPQPLHLHGSPYSTTFTMGWVDKVR